MDILSTTPLVNRWVYLFARSATGWHPLFEYHGVHIPVKVIKVDYPYLHFKFPDGEMSQRGLVAIGDIRAADDSPNKGD